MSQHEDAVGEETPQEASNTPEDAVQEEEGTPEQNAPAADPGEQEEVVDAASDTEPEEPSQEAPEVEAAPAEDPVDSLFLDPEEDEGEEFVASEDGPSVIEILDAPVEEDPKDARIEELEAQLQAISARVDEIGQELEATVKERDELKTRLLRNAADAENFRKRKEREKEEMRKYGADKIISDLLPAVDNLERALEHAQKMEEESSIADGVRMVHRQISSSLEKHGITSFESVGEKFDPQRHEAIQQVETTEFDTNVVMQEFQKGYFIHDRLLRPALTVVAKRIDPPTPAPEESEPELEEITPSPSEEGEQDLSAPAHEGSESLGDESSQAQA